MGVPDAIAQLARANLSIFILTGDKQETAINIGFACSLLHEDMERMIVNAVLRDDAVRSFDCADARAELSTQGMSKEQRDDACKVLTEEQLDKFIAATDGASGERIVVASDRPAHPHDEQMATISLRSSSTASRCATLLMPSLAWKTSSCCCRVAANPSFAAASRPRKRRKVRFLWATVFYGVRRALTLLRRPVVTLHKKKMGKTTLAIGDGANDVAMIQAAHVGVGINGEEGLQAVRSSDYAIGQFRFLVPLLLVHGRYSYRRMTKLVRISCYTTRCRFRSRFACADYVLFLQKRLSGHDAVLVCHIQPVYGPVAL